MYSIYGQKIYPWKGTEEIPFIQYKQVLNEFYFLYYDYNWYNGENHCMELSLRNWNQLHHDGFQLGLKSLSTFPCLFSMERKRCDSVKHFSVEMGGRRPLQRCQHFRFRSEKMKFFNKPRIDSIKSFLNFN